MKKQCWPHSVKKVKRSKLDDANTLISHFKSAIEKVLNNAVDPYQIRMFKALLMTCDVGLNATNNLRTLLLQTDSHVITSSTEEIVGKYILDGLSIYNSRERTRKSIVEDLEKLSSVLKEQIDIARIDLVSKKKLYRKHRNKRIDVIAMELKEIKDDCEPDEVIDRVTDKFIDDMSGLKTDFEVIDMAFDALRSKIQKRTAKTNRQMSLAHVDYLENTSFRWESASNFVIEVAIDVLDNKDPTVPGQYSYWSAIKDLYRHLRLRFLHSRMLGWFDSRKRKQVSIEYFCLPLMNIPVAACHLGSLLVESHFEELKAKRPGW
jgi:hypothetical protein